MYQIYQKFSNNTRLKFVNNLPIIQDSMMNWTKIVLLMANFDDKERDKWRESHKTILSNSYFIHVRNISLHIQNTIFACILNHYMSLLVHAHTIFAHTFISLLLHFSLTIHVHQQLSLYRHHQETLSFSKLIKVGVSNILCVLRLKLSYNW